MDEWTVELRCEEGVRVGYRICVSGDTLFVNELKEISGRFWGPTYVACS